MTQTPREASKVRQNVNDRSGEMIVISGIAGLYPGAHTVQELADILYSKKNPVSPDGLRYQFEHPEVPRYAGCLPDLQYFDAQFFKVHYHLGVMMDPSARKLLEQTYQAIFDAGIRPESLSGKKVGVFLGATSCDSEKFCTCCKNSKVGIIGSSKAMFANRISYYLNATGPSVTVDGACCGALAALQMARQAMVGGECEAAVVASAKILLHPHSAIAHGCIIPSSRDGKTRSFDEKASGPAFSEAINVLFLQKAKDALRVYAELIHVKCEFDSLHNEDEQLKLSFNREPSRLCNFMREFYQEANTSPLNVDYVEAFGSAFPDADKVELEAIDSVYCGARSGALPVGCVSSNIGYTETASGIAAITKVLLGYHTGSLAANLHLEGTRGDVACLREGRVQLLREHHRFREGYAAVNGLSITGLNAHALLHDRYKPKNLQQYKSDIPHLVTISGRHESAVNKIIEELKSNPIDQEQLALLHNIHATNNSFHMGRGFTILSADGEGPTVCRREVVSSFDDARRPLWFLYSGMGSQWATMGAHLMHIPVFAAAIQKCNRVLEPKGLDIVNIITSQDKRIFENILNSFVGIAAIQIGLTDILTELGLIPDKIIGHSVGELGCAYADGCLTAEEMILASYYRGLVSLQTPFIRGAMAAVGIGYQQIIKLCPPDIEVACHNSSESCTISGPADSVKAFTEELTCKGIFTKEVASSNIAYHSKYISEAGPGLLKYLQDLIKSPRARSERWVSTSVPRHSWGGPESKYGGAEYHTNNLLNPVLFEEASQLIPAKAVVIEIAPHGLLQAILHRSLPPSCANIPLTRRGNNDLVFLLEAIGKIYMNGFALKVSALYPKVEFPVSTGTPMLSQLVEWAHDEEWGWPRYAGRDIKLGAECKFIVTIHDDDYKYLRGHVLGGRTVYPLSAVLVDVWDTLAMSRGLQRKACSVQFRDVRISALPALHARRELRLTVSLLRASGRFEVSDDVMKIATGYIFDGKFSNKLTSLRVNNDKIDEFNVTSEDVYEMAFNRDHQYREDFRSIHSATSCLSKARVLWRRNWVTFIDALLQLDALRRPHETVSQPSFIKKIQIDSSVKDTSDKDNVLIAQVLKNSTCISCGGFLLENVQYRNSFPLSRDRILFETSKSTENEMTTEKIQTPPINLYPTCTVLLESPSADDPEVEIRVHYAGVNDLESETDFGGLNTDTDAFENITEIDFSGKLNNGGRVMGVSWARGASWSARRLVWPAPPHWGLQDAATVPRAYCLAYYCLVLRYQLLPGMRIYVEDGLSAFGQAVISIATSMDCEVFSSVGTAQEKRYLMALFPKIKDDHISGFEEFSDMILSVTKGSGCHFVISSPKGELMMDTLRCAGNCGITIVTNCAKDKTFGLYNMFKSRSFIFLNSSLLQSQSVEDLQQLQRLVAEGISRGAVRPLTRLPQRLAGAARCAATARPPGAVLLHLQQDAPAAARFSCSPDKTQILVCANEATGILLAEKLVRVGARLLHINSPASTNYTKETWKLWFNQDVRIHSSSEDLSTLSNIDKLLTECGKEASVESIHVITFDESRKRSADVTNLTIHNLDKASRKLCPQLKYFTVLSDDDVEEVVCKSRSQQKLPTTFLKLSNLIKINSEDPASTDAITRWEAVNALEKAVTSREGVLVAKKQATPAPSLLADMAHLMNVNLSEETADACLAALGLTAARARVAAQRLRSAHGLALSEEQLLALTVDRLREIGDIIYEREFDEPQGLDKFLCHVEPDALLATVEMLFLPTLAVRDMGVDEVAVGEPHVVVVGGAGGRLGARLRLPALELRPGLGAEWDTAAEARRYVQILLTKMELKGHFYLLGYVTGVQVALEMAYLLEDHGLTGTVFCVGGSPQTISAAVDEVLSSYGSDDALRAAVAWRVTRRLQGEQRGDRGEWGERSVQYERLAQVAAYKRLQRARRCEVGVRSQPLRSQLVALLPDRCSVTALSELQRHSRQPVRAYRLRAPLARAADDLRCAALVNRHLADDILQRFQAMNRCERYYMFHASYSFF